MPAIDEPQRAVGYVPTLLDYAKVIVWLDERFRTAAHFAGVDLVDYEDMGVPEHIERAYADAIRRESLGRVAKAMQAAEDAASDLTEAKRDSLGGPIDWRRDDCGRTGYAFRSGIHGRPRWPELLDLPLDLAANGCADTFAEGISSAVRELLWSSISEHASDFFDASIGVSGVSFT
jgi:hypothetical protein